MKKLQNYKRVGVLGGTFDPLHFGHLNMAIALLEAYDLDHVYFCPTSISALKTHRPPVAPAQDRLAMVECGIQRIKSFSVLDWEMQTSGVCYTIDTIRKLKEQTDSALFLLLGEDQLFELHRWKEVETLFSLCTPLIATRKTAKPAPLTTLSSSLQSLITKGLTPIPMMDISSTHIRERLRQKKICFHLVPDLVLDYIERHILYYAE